MAAVNKILEHDEFNKGALPDHLFMLVDLPLLDELPHKPVFFKADDWVFLLDGTDYYKYQHQGPILAQLKKDSPWLNWFINSQDAANMALLLEANVSLKELAEHFQQYAAAVDSEQNKKFLFRFYDPRNLKILLESFTDEEHRLFLGPVSTMHWKRGEEDKPLYLKTSNPLPALAETKASFWPLSAATAVALEDHTLPLIVEEILKRLSNFSDLKREIDLLGPKAAEKLVYYAIDKAKASGLSSFRAYQEHTVLILRFGQFFDIDPQYSWVAINPPNETPQERWDRIWALADETYEDIYEKNFQARPNAINRLYLLQYEDLMNISYSKSLECILTQIWPERFAAFCEDGIKDDLIPGAYIKSKQQALKEHAGAFIIACLDFILGYRSLEADIRYPWLHHLGRRLVKVPEGKRTEFLFLKLKNYLKYANKESLISIREARKLKLNNNQYLDLLRLSQITEKEIFQIETNGDFNTFLSKISPERFRKVPKLFISRLCDIISGDVKSIIALYPNLRKYYKSLSVVLIAAVFVMRINFRSYSRVEARKFYSYHLDFDNLGPEEQFNAIFNLVRDNASSRCDALYLKKDYIIDFRVRSI